MNKALLIESGSDIGYLGEMRKVVKKRKPVLAIKLSQPFVVDQREMGKAGDYVVQTNDGFLHMCDAETFEQVYELAR